jgi:hypothetical protein
VGASSKEVPTAFGPLCQVLGLRCRYLRTHGAPRNTCLLLRVGNQGACQGLLFVRATLSILAQLGISPLFGFSLFLQWAIFSEARPISPCALCTASVICPKRCESLTTGLWAGPLASQLPEVPIGHLPPPSRAFSCMLLTGEQGAKQGLAARSNTWSSSCNKDQLGSPGSIHAVHSPGRVVLSTRIDPHADLMGTTAVSAPCDLIRHLYPLLMPMASQCQGPPPYTTTTLFSMRYCK